MGNVALSSARLWSHYFLSLLLGWVVYSWKWHHSIFQPFDNIRLRVSPLPISPHLLITPISHSSFHFCLFLHFSPHYILSLRVLFLFLLLISLLLISSHILFTIFSPSISLSHLCSSSLLLFFSSPLVISPLPVSLIFSLLFLLLTVSPLLTSTLLLVSPLLVSTHLPSTRYSFHL